jgi:oxygen-independent coproporphyrinogen-3 oxidase
MDTELLAKYDRGVPRYTSYPTAPHFTAQVGAADYGRWLAAVPNDSAVSVYGHIPFCDSLCWFCGCHTKIVRRYEPIAAYLEALGQEIDLVGRALGPRRTLAQLHFGGGSPTILAAEDVAALRDRLERHFAFTEETQFSVEIDPRDAEEERIAAWAAAGVTRASLGVQDLDPEVQRAINRVQSFEETRTVVDWLRAAGVRQINIDLMYGLPHQTVERSLDTVEQVLALAPDRLALFGYAHVPWMKRHQRLIPEAALPDATARFRQSEAVARRLVEAGYRPIGLDHFARPGDPLATAQAAGTLHRSFQGYSEDATPVLIGLGASAIGTLPEGYIQNAVPIKAYAETVRAGRLATVRGFRLGHDDRLRRAVIERLMCDFRVDLPALAAAFGVTTEVFAPELAALAPLEADGLVDVVDDTVRVTQRGRPLVRAVAACFDAYLGHGKTRHSRAL